MESKWNWIELELSMHLMYYIKIFLLVLGRALAASPRGKKGSMAHILWRVPHKQLSQFAFCSNNNAVKKKMSKRRPMLWLKPLTSALHRTSMWCNWRASPESAENGASASFKVRSLHSCEYLLLTLWSTNVSSWKLINWATCELFVYFCWRTINIFAHLLNSL